jgi:hypothetical protein
MLQAVTDASSSGKSECLIVSIGECDAITTQKHEKVGHG